MLIECCARELEYWLEWSTGKQVRESWSGLLFFCSSGRQHAAADGVFRERVGCINVNGVEYQRVESGEPGSVPE